MGNTANNNWPYPESTDLVKDGATAIENLADAIDTTLGVYVPAGASGLELINTTSFSAVASQSINSVFSSTYDNYRIVMSNLEASGATTGITFRLRKAGSDNSSNIYYRQDLNASSTSVTGNRVQSTSWIVAAIRDQGPQNSVFDIFLPNLSTRKTTAVGNFGFDAYNVIQLRNFSAGHDLASSADFDGFSLIAESGNMSGTVSVYGYNK
jgi:hypothetical protein